MTPRLTTYITAHGFGHATRAIQVLNAIHRQRPEAEIQIRTAAPERLFRYYLDFPAQIEHARIDCGAGELGFLDVDIPGTLAALQEIHGREEQLLESEIAALRDFRPDGVIFDVPPLAAEIADALEVPSFGIANFTWDFIYEDYLPAYPAFGPLIERIRDAFSKTTLGLQTPLSHELTAFPRREKIPLITRRGLNPAVEFRKGAMPHVLIALRDPLVRYLAPNLAEVPARFIAFGAEPLGANILTLDESWQPRFSDIMAACDIVLSKPGYGIIGECIANGKPLIHFDRRDFREKYYLLAGMDPVIAHRQLQLEGLSPAMLAEAVEELAPQQGVKRETAINGAEAAAEIILRNIS